MSAPSASFARYLSSICLIAAAAVQITHFVVSGIIESERSQPPQNRDPSRVELVMQARNAAFVRLPNSGDDTTIQPPAGLEIAAVNQLAASNLAIEIDVAELADAPPVEAAVDAEPKTPKKYQRMAAHKRVRPPAMAELDALAAATRLPDVLGSPSANPSAFKAAIQSTMPAKVEPIRKRLANKNINAGELVRMQLLNLI